MLPILKQQLTIFGAATLLCGALLGPARPAMAQPQPNPEQTSPLRAKLGFGLPRIDLTRDLAAQKFIELLRIMSGPPVRQDKPDEALMSSFSRSSETEDLLPLLLKMSKQFAAPEPKMTLQDETETIATLIIESKSRPLILVKEGQSWGVDVPETFAKWNGVEGAERVAAVAQAVAEFGQVREGARRSSCQSNLKQMALGMLQYAQDYDGEKLPDATKWIDKLMPYVKSEELFTCPSVTEPEGNGYAFNLNLSLQSLAAMGNVSQTVAIYETTILERNSFGAGDDPAFRHEGGANYAFVDGHVKWFPKTEIPSFKMNP